MGTSDYLRRLSEYLCDSGLESLPADVVDRGRWVIADCLPLIATGMRVAEMKSFAEGQLAGGSAGGASVIGLGRSADPMTAALLNGTAGTWLEMVEDNLEAKGHPAIQVVPAAIAMAEQGGASGRALLLAVILGYEACARISRATKTKLALHPHGTFGTIGAAVAVARLAGYGADSMRTIINVAATLGLATSRKAIREGATVGRVLSGVSGQMGILAHHLVESGFSGEADGVRSVYGSIYADPPDVVSAIPQAPKVPFDPDMVVAGLGEEFLIRGSFIKLHACARSAHPALDLIEEVMAGRPGGRLDPDGIERIDFRSYFSPTTLSTRTVDSSLHARFSVPFAVASLIVHGRRGLDNFGDAAVANPVIRALALRVGIEEDPAYTALFPGMQRCDVRVTFKDRTTAEARADHTRGDRRNPRRAEEMKGKFVDVADRVWGRPHSESLFAGLMAIEQIDDVRAFLHRHPV